MLASNVSLGALRLQAQQRADLENSPTVSTSEWNQYISQSYKRLYNMLVGAYGNDYYVAFPGSGTSPLFQFALNGAQYYPLPDGTIASLGATASAPALYKLLGVDLQYSASPTGWVTLRRFEEMERNKYAFPNTAVNLLGYTNLRYRLSGINIEFIPVPMSGQVIQIKYIPKPTSLQFLPSCVTNSTTTITMADASDISAGMSVYGPGVQSGTVVSSVDKTTTPNQVVISKVTLSSLPVVTLAFWIDSVTIDGVAGWEEYIVIDAAIKAKIKQEEDVSELKEQKADMTKEIEALAEGRDAGQAHHVTDALGANGYGYDGFGSSGGYGDL